MTDNGLCQGSHVLGKFVSLLVQSLMVKTFFAIAKARSRIPSAYVLFILFDRLVIF